MIIQEIMAVGIGLIQGMVFIPFTLVLPSIVVERMMQWKRKHLPFWKYIITLNGIFFSIIAFFGIGWIWIDILSADESRSNLTNLWGKSWFVGMILSMAIGIIEEEIRKRKKKN